MIDRPALEHVAARQVASMQCTRGVPVLLHVARVYPADEDLEDELPREASGASLFDRLLLPASTTSYVTRITQWTEKKPG